MAVELVKKVLKPAGKGAHPIKVAAILGLLVVVDALLHIAASHLASYIFWRETWAVWLEWTIPYQPSSVTGGLAAIFFLLSVCFLVRNYRQRRNAFRYFTKLGIRGPKPHIIKGNGDLLRNPSFIPIEVMDRWRNEFGPVYGYYVGMKPYVAIQDLDLIQQVLVRDFHKFVNRPAMGIEIRPVSDTLVGLRGQRWKEVRRVISPAFSGRKMRKISVSINRCVDVMVEVVGQHSTNNNDINFFSLFQGLTCQVIGECALDTAIDCQRQPQDEFLNALRQFLKKANNPIIDLAIYFPLIKQMLAVVCRLASPCGQFTQSIIDKVQSVIEQRRADRLVNGAPSNHHDILQLLMEASENRLNSSDALERNDDEEEATTPHALLTDAEIVANAWVFLLGGFETTANALTYCAYALATHPHIQDKLYDELVQHLGESSGDAETDYDTISQLTYLDQVFCEVLRLYPPVVLFVTREAAEDAQLGPYRIPAGTNIQIPVWQIHHDPNVWPDPYRFDPDRFEPELKKNRHPMAWIPFGSGPRSCLGIRFALLEAKIALAKLIMKYRLVPCQRTEAKITLAVPTVTLNPLHGVWLKAEAR